ncbi:MAG: DNA-binding response regulator, partial [Candidatus Omnitrophota bacterium]
MKKKILVVDDEPDIVDLIQSRLVRQGYEVICAYNGAEALR